MLHKAAVPLVLSIVAVIGGMALNFEEFLMGSTATPKNLMVTLLYIAMWIFVLVIGVKIKNRGIIIYCSVFWLITLLLAILTAYVNATDTPADWALPLVILLMGQWYGINFFVGDFFSSSIIIACISLVLYITSLIMLKCQNRN